MLLPDILHMICDYLDKKSLLSCMLLNLDWFVVAGAKYISQLKFDRIRLQLLIAMDNTDRKHFYASQIKTIALEAIEDWPDALLAKDFQGLTFSRVTWLSFYWVDLEFEPDAMRLFAGPQLREIHIDDFAVGDAHILPLFRDLVADCHVETLGLMLVESDSGEIFTDLLKELPGLKKVLLDSEISTTRIHKPHIKAISKSNISEVAVNSLLIPRVGFGSIDMPNAHRCRIVDTHFYDLSILNNTPNCTVLHLSLNSFRGDISLDLDNCRAKLETLSIELGPSWLHSPFDMGSFPQLKHLKLSRPFIQEDNQEGFIKALITGAQLLESLEISLFGNVITTLIDGIGKDLVQVGQHCRKLRKFNFKTEIEISGSRSLIVIDRETSDRLAKQDENPLFPQLERCGPCLVFLGANSEFYSRHFPRMYEDDRYTRIARAQGHIYTNSGTHDSPSEHLAHLMSFSLNVHGGIEE